MLYSRSQVGLLGCSEEKQMRITAQEATKLATERLSEMDTEILNELRSKKNALLDEMYQMIAKRSKSGSFFISFEGLPYIDKGYIPDLWRKPVPRKGRKYIVDFYEEIMDDFRSKGYKANISTIGVRVCLDVTWDHKKSFLKRIFGK